MLGSRSFLLGHVRGIAVRADTSWLAVAALVTWSFWERFDARADVSGPTALLMAGAGAALFFASILAHELAHALEAQARGVGVRGITLFLFGGVTESRLEPDRPIDEFALTAFGPFTSFVAGASLGLGATVAAEVGWDEAAAVMGHVGWLNVALGLFNLLPGAPLDGGRILRAAVWRVTGDRRRATTVAGRAGQVLGALLIALGLTQVFFLPAAFVGGLWLAFIGWFLVQAATAEVAHAEAERWLAGLPAAALADASLEPIPADHSVQAAVDGWFRLSDTDTFPVTSDGSVVGVVRTDDVRRVPPTDRPSLPVSAVMRSVEGLPKVGADEDAATLLAKLGEEGVAVVTDRDRAVGVVSAERLARLVQRRAVLGRDAPQ